MFKQKLVTYLTLSLVFFHLLGLDIVTNINIVLLLFVTLFYKNRVEQLIKLTFSFKFWVLISPFLLFLISIIYTNHSPEGWKMIELRLTLLIFPLIYGLSPITSLQKLSVFKFFIILVSLIPLIGFMYQLPNYINTNDSGYFYNDNLVIFAGKQAAYFGMYINIALIGLFYIWYNNLLKTKLERIVSVVSLILLLAAQYLLASRTAILITLTSTIVFLILLGINRIDKKKAFILIFSFGLFITSLVILFPKVLKRFESVKQTEYRFDNPNQINHFNGEINKENWNGLNTRLAIWNCAWDEIKKNPIIGCGIGGVQPNLIKNYKSKNFNFAINSNYNSHNQYLDILLSNGFVGLSVFLFFIGYLIFNAIQTRNWLLLGIVLIFMISCLTENILSRNQGVFIIWGFFSILMAGNLSKPKEDDITKKWATKIIRAK